MAKSINCYYREKKSEICTGKRHNKQLIKFVNAGKGCFVD